MQTNHRMNARSATVRLTGSSGGAVVLRLHDLEEVGIAPHAPTGTTIRCMEDLGELSWSEVARVSGADLRTVKTAIEEKAPEGGTGVLRFTATSSALEVRLRCGLDRVWIVEGAFCRVDVSEADRAPLAPERLWVETGGETVVLERGDLMTCYELDDPVLIAAGPSVRPWTQEEADTATAAEAEPGAAWWGS